ncbi:MAG: phage tail sheath C-terminal domain-containing protein [Candidatus Woesearchaeota archaeon]
MATLVSPGVSVTIVDESFYIPVSAPTVPLFFIATKSGKMQPNGLTPAAGSNEHSVVRTVTSLGQSTQLYGIPSFREDINGQYHGDARNEYGLFALNQFLGVGNRAFVVRANIDLTDATLTLVRPDTIVSTVPTFVGVGNGVLSAITPQSQTVVETITLTCIVGDVVASQFTVEGSQSGLIGVATNNQNFVSSRVNFTLTNGSTNFSVGDKFVFSFVYDASTSYNGVNPIVGNGGFTSLTIDTLVVPETWTIEFTSPTTFNVTGSLSGPFTAGSVGVPYDNNYLNFQIDEGSIPFAVGDTFEITLISQTISNPLGANDAAKRVAIKTALQAEINSNTEVRSETYEYNLILCPGYPEVVDELLALSVDIMDEAFVIADTPVDKTPEQVAVWALTTDRYNSSSVAYYYPWGLASNLDGKDVVCAPSGIALRTYAYSDNISYVWFAPAGARRGLVTGVSKVGYVTGTLGTATTFVECNLNQGQRDNLYEFFKNINPIVYFPGRGILIWGQKTSATAASALDRVNVVRMLMYLKRSLRKGAFPFVFEPNDQVTRDNLKAAADGFLNDILIKRGLYDFATLSDETNNTPDRIDRNELWLDVAVKPMKAAEFIYIPIRVVSTGATI